MYLTVVMLGLNKIEAGGQRLEVQYNFILSGLFIYKAQTLRVVYRNIFDI